MHRIASIALLTISFLLFFATVFGTHGMVRLNSVRLEVEQLQRKNNEIQSEIIDLNNQIYALRESDYVLEKSAREDLGLSKPGEIVYVFQHRERDTARR